MPDMMPHQISEAHRSLAANDTDRIVIFNVSEACLLLPRRILKRAGSGDRCFWEKTDEV